jgi:hypothetical protein
VAALPASVFAARYLGFQADSIQAEVLDTDEKKIAICCTRQWGKTTVTSLRALHFALMHPETLTICVAGSLRQSSIFIDCVAQFLQRMRLPWKRDRREPLSVMLPNGSSLVGLPANSRTIRGFGGVSFLILDEAAYIPDAVYQAARPFRATTNGLFWVLSTPDGQAGFFYDIFHRMELNWRRFRVTARECPRISAEFLAEEELEMGPTKFGQEYLCRFLASADQWISRGLVESAITAEEPHPAGPPKVVRLVRPVQTARPSSQVFVGLDLGFSRDRTALVVLEEMTRPTGEYDYDLMVDRMETVLVLRRVEAVALQTPYREVPRLVEEVLAAYPKARRKEVAVDATGVGLPVVEMLQEARLDACLTPITLTSGESLGNVGHAVTVPRRVLPHNLRRVLETGGLRIPVNLAGLDELMAELVALGNARTSKPDDLAFALAFALWAARPAPYVGERRELLPGTPGGDSEAAVRYAERELERRRRVG